MQRLTCTRGTSLCQEALAFRLVSLNKQAVSRTTIIGQRVEQARKRAGLSRHELAKRLDSTTQTIWRYERGKIQLSTHILSAISHIVGVPVSWLLGEDVAASEPRVPSKSTSERLEWSQLKAFTASQREAMLDGLRALLTAFEARGPNLRASRFADRLRAALRVSGLSDAELARACHVTLQTLEAWIMGVEQPSKDQLRIIATRTGIDFQVLLLGLEQAIELAAKESATPAKQQKLPRFRRSS